MSDDPSDPGSIPPPPGAAAPLPPPPGALPLPPPPPAPIPPPPPPFEYPPLPVSAPVQKRGMAGRLGAGLVGLAVLGGGLSFAVSQSGGGGESSPEAAARALFDAVAAEDVIGMLDVLPAAERRAFQDPIEDVVEELARLGVVGDDLDLGAVGGLDLEFEGLELETEDITEGFAMVRLVGGTTIFSVEPGDLPIGDDLREVIEDVSGEPLEIEPVEETRDEFEPGEDELEMVAVEEDGSWRISVFYSIAEAARRDAGLPAPDFGNGFPPAGADSPEAAVEALIRAAAEEQDLTAILALLPPDETNVVGMSTVQVEGQRYVSPMRTVLDSLVAVLRGLQDDALSRLPELFEGFFGFSEEGFSEVGSAIPEIDDLAEMEIPDVAGGLRDDGASTDATALEPPTS